MSALKISDPLGSALDSSHGGPRNRETAKDILHEVLHPHTQPSAVAVQYPKNGTCVDNDAAIRREAEARGYPEISGCVDVGGMCIDVDGIGAVARRICCSTCTAPSAPTQSLPSPSVGPVDIYFLAGQSGCVGLSSVAKLKASGRYSSLEREQPKVWFAGYHGVQSPEMFTIKPMSPTANNLNTFGPELSLGERLHSLTGRPIVLVKYCWGGSSAQFDWNPSTQENGWDRQVDNGTRALALALALELALALALVTATAAPLALTLAPNRQADNGTAAWLIEPTQGGVNLGKRRMVYKNFVYTYRRTLEALRAGGVAHTLKGLVWIQGQADAGRRWDEFGTDEKRVLDALRCDLGHYRLPIVSQGSGYIDHLRSGKALAQASVEGCNLVVLEMALAAHKATAPGQRMCRPNPGDNCLEGLYLNLELFEFYGYDPNFPAELRPEGATTREFAWFVDMDSNFHAEFDGQVLFGRTIADAFVQGFSAQAVPTDAITARDAALQFPWQPCARGHPASATHLCWEDLRPAGQARTCREVAKEQSCLAMPSYHPPAMAPFAIVACVALATCIALSCRTRLQLSPSPSPSPSPSAESEPEPERPAPNPNLTLSLTLRLSLTPNANPNPNLNPNQLLLAAVHLPNPNPNPTPTQLLPAAVHLLVKAGLQRDQGRGDISQAGDLTSRP